MKKSKDKSVTSESNSLSSCGFYFIQLWIAILKHIIRTLVQLTGFWE